MGIYAIGLTEETARGTDASGTIYWLPATGSLMPDFTADDQARQEFRGVDSALGPNENSIVRRESQATHALECAFYPGIATGMLFKHALGKEGTRAVEDVSAYKGPLYPLAQPYGTGAELGDTALGMWVLFDLEGVTQKQYFGGMRPFDFTVTAQGTDDVMLTFNTKAPGEYATVPVTNDLTPDYSGLTDPFVSSDISCYIGTTVSVTGTAPDYTDISPGTMTKFCPDSVTLTLTSGLDDKVQLCGVQGPDKTFRSAQFAGTAVFPIDFADPSSGFSSNDEWVKKFTGPNTNVLLFVLDNDIVAGDTTQTYETTFYFPAMLNNPDTPAIQADGTQATVNFNYSTLNDETATKPFIMQTIDKASGYPV